MAARLFKIHRDKIARIITSGDLSTRNGTHPPMRDIPKLDPVNATGSLKAIE